MIRNTLCNIMDNGYRFKTRLLPGDCKSRGNGRKAEAKAEAEAEETLISLAYGSFPF
jgi:hypothetical protein